MYFDENLVNQEGTVSFEKHRKITSGIEEFLESKMYNDSSVNEAYRNKEAVLREEMNLTVHERFFTKEDEITSFLNESVELEATNTNDLFVDLLCETVIRALNIDEKLIEGNRDEITAKVKGFYTEMGDAINLEGSQIIVDLITKCRDCSKTFNIEKHDALYEEVDNIATIIKEKVAKVIEDEKTMSSLEIMQEEDKYSCSIDIKLTLFKEMEIENVKMAIKECSNRTDIDKNSLLLMSFYETVVDYTLLETFNTLKLIEFATDMYDDSSRKKMIDYDIKDIW